MFSYLWGYCWKCEFDYRCQNGIESYYHHDGEQLLFYKKLHQNTEQKERCSCNYIIARNEEFQFI